MSIKVCPLYESMKLLGTHFRFRDMIIWDQLHSETKTAWGSWRSASAPYIRHMTEFLLIYYKKTWKKDKGESDMSSVLFTELVNDIWRVKPETDKKLRRRHPAPFPVELVTRCMKLFSFVGDTILDPFGGSGTTAVAGKLCGRKVILVEKEKKYCKLIVERVEATTERIFV